MIKKDNGNDKNIICGVVIGNSTIMEKLKITNCLGNSLFHE